MQHKHDPAMVGKVRPHPTYRHCSFVITERGSANFFGPDHLREATVFAQYVASPYPQDAQGRDIIPDEKPF